MMLSAKLLPIRKSSCFDASGYFGGRAAFRYCNGRVIFREIPVTLWQRFMEAESKGKFFKEEIKFVRKSKKLKRAGKGFLPPSELQEVLHGNYHENNQKA